MRSQAIIFLLPIVILASSSIAAPEQDKRQFPSPDLRCGRLLGPDLNYFCPTSLPCCSYWGYCGSTDAYCNVLAGCQTLHSNHNVPNCHTPIDKVTVSPNGNCGRKYEQTWGYRCPGGENPCCSASFFCGNTPDHCDVRKGCKKEYGICNSF